MSRILFIVFFIYTTLIVQGQSIITINAETTEELGEQLFILEDPSEKLTIEEIIKIKSEFTPSHQKVPNFEATLSAIWVRFQVINTDNNNYFLQIDNPTLDKIDLYTLSSGKILQLQQTGDLFPFNQREIKRNNYIIPLNLPKGELQEFYLRYTGTEGMELPMKITSAKSIIEKSYPIDLANGIYYGVMLATILYNLFLFIMIRDRSYIYYTLFVCCFSLLQAEIMGHSFEFLWPDSPWFSNQGIFLFSSISGIFAVQFGRHFLKTKKRIPKLHSWGVLLIVLWIVIIVLSLSSKFLSEDFILLNEYLISLSGLLFSPYMFVMGLMIYYQGFRPARFYLIAWAVLFIAIIIFVLKSNNLLPHNFFTENILQVGSALEAILLSLALGDRYNELKKEKEETQKMLNLELKQTNKKLIKINSDLDNFVYTASHDLKAPISNIEGLIEALKSDSCYAHQDIGQIIDLMTASVQRFKTTINDLTEITSVQKEVEEDTDWNNIDEVLEEIKILLKKQIEESNAEIKTELNELRINFSKKNFRSIVYNLISNAIKYRSPDRKPELLVTTKKYKHFIILSIQDNGLGISLTSQKKIFQMFKRAHDHVEGTGIGLYLVKRMIENADGHIEVESKEGLGAIFKVYFSSTN